MKNKAYRYNLNNYYTSALHSLLDKREAVIDKQRPKMKTIKDLIEALSKFDENLEVVTTDEYGDAKEFDSAELDERKGHTDKYGEMPSVVKLYFF